MTFKLPDLGYGFDALEPHIDTKTMQIHHGKHHATYVEKLNTVLQAHSDLQDKSIEQLLSDIKTIPVDIKTAVQNNGGGHHNHSLFWESLKPGGAKVPSGRVGEAINQTFSSFVEFKTKMTEAGVTCFGSGWAWLVSNGGSLEVYSTANQDSPLMEGKVPLLGLDVWEHAYYLKYQNQRPQYIEAWWNVINWSVVEERLGTLTS